MNKKLLPMVLTLCMTLTSTHLVTAAVVAEGTYQINTPHNKLISFHLLVAEDGARLVSSQGKTLIFSYDQRSIIILDIGRGTYLPVPFELVPLLLEGALGYTPLSVNVRSTGRQKKILGHSCREVIFSEHSSGLIRRSWRIDDPSWNSGFHRLENSLGLFRKGSSAALEHLGIPLRGYLKISSPRHHYQASWEISKLYRKDHSGDDFVVPPGFSIDLEALLSLPSRPGTKP